MKKLLLTLLFIQLFCSKGFMQKGSYAFQFPTTGRTENPILDLRFLNENEAGSHGFIQLSPDGNSFVRGDGERIRFWAVNSGGAGMSDEKLEQHARFLASIGVNMVRHHGSINPAGKGAHLYDVDSTDIKNIWKLVATMKKYGIYTTISPFWPHNGHMGGWVPEEWGIEGFSGKDDLWGVIYFNDKLQDAYKNWVRVLYTSKNPYTGIALKDDPAVGLIQIMNEDGVFFWTMQNMRPALKKMIESKYKIWLKKKYGSLNDAFTAWGDAQLSEDDPGKETVGLYSTWEMTQVAEGNKKIRMRDQVEFYADAQFDFYRNIYSYYKDVLGCKQLINSMNWTTADPSRLLDLERWTNTACDVIALNRYYDPGHFGENNGWRIDPGHFYMGESVLKNPQKLPINVKQVSGHPMIVTESGWNLPHKYTSEGPLVIAALQSITGVDAFYWFHANAVDYDPDPYFRFISLPNGQYPMHRWTCSLPGIMGQFPANALMYRMAYIKPGELVYKEDKPVTQLWEREISALVEERNFDPNRDKENNIFDTIHSALSPLVFLTGTAEVSYKGKFANTFIHPRLREWIDPEKKTIVSSTGEMTWDYGKGLLIVNAEKTKAVCGFLETQKEFHLGKVVFHSGNRYASMIVVSMDNAPIESSGKILIQAGTIYQPTGWQEEKAEYVNQKENLQGYKIVNTGRMPWRADETDLTLEIFNSGLKKASLLDAGGYFVKEIPLKKSKEAISFKLPTNALYVILE